MKLNDLRQRVEGTVLEPGSEEFRAAIEVWNARFNRSPEVVVSCRTTGDVRAAVHFATGNDLKIAVKAGGHSYAALSVLDGGLLIDLSRMKRLEVDPSSRSAVIEPGVTCAELDAATQAHGLATPLPTVSSVGVVGAALGGGAGYLSRRYGLTLDNLVSAEMVLADGEVIEVSQEENEDLFWAIRGGGGNFGVVTSMKLRLHEVGPTVVSGQVIYPFDEAGSRLRAFRDFMASASDELQIYPFCFRAPPIELFPDEMHGQPVLDFVICHQDTEALGDLDPLRDLGEPVLNLVGPAPYVDAQRAFDANLPKGQRYLSKAHDLDGLSDGAIDTMVEFVPQMAGALTAAYFDPLGGAIARVDTEATAYAGRKTSYGFHIIAGWMDPLEDDTVIGWASAFHEAMSRHANGGVYVNLIGDDELDRVPTAYGGNYARLIQQKRKWDPANLFASNYNIPV